MRGKCASSALELQRAIPGQSRSTIVHSHVANGRKIERAMFAITASSGPDAFAASLESNSIRLRAVHTHAE
jgi:hypothetical protein